MPRLSTLQYSLDGRLWYTSAIIDHRIFEMTAIAKYKELCLVGVSHSVLGSWRDEILPGVVKFGGAKSTGNFDPNLGQKALLVRLLPPASMSPSN